jgi:acetoin utilization deacetylase AcuC-like enzyme
MKVGVLFHDKYESDWKDVCLDHLERNRAQKNRVKRRMMKPNLERRSLLEGVGAATLGVGALSVLGGFPSVLADNVAEEKLGIKRGGRGTGWLWDDRYLLHSQRKGHPESPERLKAIGAQLKNSGLLNDLVPLKSEVESEDYISMVHSKEHLGLVKKQAHDESICRLAVSGALSAVEAVCSAKVQNAFVALRPPGHHAANKGEFGFCFYNNIAVAARYAQKRFNIGKVLIVDWDYHHGDGTEWAFYDDPSVLFFSTHALKAFPGTGSPNRVGSGRGKGFNINVPLPNGAGDRDIIQAFESELLPAVEQFRPELVLVSAGFDAREEDLLGDFNITDAGFAKLTQMVMSIAKKYSGSRVVSLLEGGYNTRGLALAVEAHLKVLLKEG